MSRIFCRLSSLCLFMSILLNFVVLTGLVKAEAGAEVAEEEIVCPETSPDLPVLARSATYKGLPYAAGEEARYELKYGALRVLVGYGYLRVDRPINREITVAVKDGKAVREKRWHRVYSAEGSTGDWYRRIFQAHDKLQSIARPWDHGASHFYISQNEQKPFSKPYLREKWLEFDHVTCEVETREVNHEKKQSKTEQYGLQPNAMDALSALFHLRTLKYKIGDTQRLLVHTSEKNWWLEATPLKVEKVTVNAGTFLADKLEIKSYLGSQLQQKGNMAIWIAKDHPQRPMVKVEGDVTFGSIYLELDQFKAGGA
ncbi:MAG: DUF3108 domain-containing protein [Oligoflexus sp.]